MPEIHATYRIVTPVFLGGEDPKRGVALRWEPAFKGALRFWWRALRWPRVRSQAGGDDLQALRRLHEDECRLFGGPGDAGGGGRQAACLLRITPMPAMGRPPQNTTSGHEYLLGQGLCRPASHNNPTGYLRACVPAGNKLQVTLRCRDLQEALDLGLVDALQALGLLGGVGARSRRGLGSLAIQSIEAGGEACSVPRTVDEIGQWLSARFDGPIDEGPPLPPFTAFSSHARVDVSMSDTARGAFQTRAWRLLGQVGQKLWEYRSYRGDCNFPSDHGQVRDLIRLNKCAPTHPQRVVFGLPHNYFFSSLPPGGQKADIHACADGRTRRASPLFIHAHVFPDNHVCIVQSKLPARFLPDSDRVHAEAETGHTCDWEARPDWAKIDDYLNGFSGYTKVL